MSLKFADIVKCRRGEQSNNFIERRAQFQLFHEEATAWSVIDEFVGSNPWNRPLFLISRSIIRIDRFRSEHAEIASLRSRSVAYNNHAEISVVSYEAKIVFTESIDRVALNRLCHFSIEWNGNRWLDGAGDDSSERFISIQPSRWQMR